MNPLLIKLAARVAVHLAKRQAFRAAARRFGGRKTAAAAAAAYVAGKLLRRGRGR